MPAASRNDEQKNASPGLPGLVGNPMSRSPNRPEPRPANAPGPEGNEEQTEEFYREVGKEEGLEKPQRSVVKPGLPPEVDYRKIQSEREKRGKIAFFTIYKSGQGYWTRMGTVAGASLILAWSVYFLNGYLKLWLAWTAGGPENPLLVSLTAGVIGLMVCFAVRVPAMISVAVGFGVTIGANIASWRGLFGQTTAPGLQVMTAFLGLYVASFTLLVFRLINQPRNVDFLIATDSEMKKVNWTTRAELIGSTKVVIAFVILIALFLFVTDLAFSTFFNAIGVLKVGPW